MTRINCGILPSELSTKHLVAELREIKRIPNHIINNKDNLNLKGIPNKFRLGRGHIKFFYNKLEYLYKRYKSLYYEAKIIRKNFYEDKWKKILWTETHPYIYILDRYYSYDDILQKSFNTSNIQQINATIKLVEREYRPHWFKKIPIFRKITKSIDIEFDKEVGERAGNYKGGTVGCSYELLPKETPLECLRRMEKERKF